MLNFIPDKASPHNLAQQLTLAITDNPEGKPIRDYKAPHAMRGTPPRARLPREQRHLIDAGDAETGRPALVRRPRLFKGHRP